MSTSAHLIPVIIFPSFTFSSSPALLKSVGPAEVIHGKTSVYLISMKEEGEKQGLSPLSKALAPSQAGKVLMLSEIWMEFRNKGKGREDDVCCKAKLQTRCMLWEKTQRQAMQLGASTDTLFCLSSFLLRAELRQVMAGLYFWQTRGSSTLSKHCTTPPRLLSSCNKAKAA